MTTKEETIKWLKWFEIIAGVAALVNLGFKIFSNYDNQWFILITAIISLILILIIYFYRASRLRYFFRRLKRLFDKEPFVKWFVDREHSRPDMSRQLHNYSWLVFVGVSQRSLTTYLEEALSTKEEFPWSEVEVYFSSDQLGQIYEENDFLLNLKSSRQEIVKTLTSPLEVKS